jgi:hypothetical protein
MAILKNTTVNDTGFLQLPAGTTAQRPSPVAGQMRFNTTTGKAEFYSGNAAAWIGTASSGVIATGGNSVYDVDVDGVTYRVHVFTSIGDSTFTVIRGGRAEYLIVAGGGSGGSGEGNPAGDSPGGGGAGGLLTGFTTVTPQAYTITVGAGASTRVTTVSANGSNGQNSSAFGLTAIGGGAGAREEGPGFAGGSGGGGGGSCISGRKAGGSATAGQGNAGGTGGDSGCSRRAGGGGGGAGIAGGDDRGNFGGNGGNGLLLGITGIYTFYAGGGGGGNSANQGGAAGLGGLGGGGAGGTSPNGPGTDATPNTGAGGGGTGSGTSLINGLGGSGIVVVRYPLNLENPVIPLGKVIETGLLLDLDFAKPAVYVGSGTVVNDSRLNGITGSLINSPVYSDSRSHRSGFRFTQAASSTLESTLPLTAIPASLGWTLECMVRPDAFPTSGTVKNGVLLGAAYYTGAAIYWRGNSAGTAFNVFGYVRTTGYFATAQASLALNTWYHLVAVQDPTALRLRLYLNGSLFSEVTGTNTNYAASEAGIAGNIGINRAQVDGGGAEAYVQSTSTVSIAKVYNRALTGTEVANNFNATRWRFGI